MILEGCKNAIFMKFLEYLPYLDSFLKWGSSKFEVLWSNKEDTAYLSPILFCFQFLELKIWAYVSFELNLYLVY